MNTAIAEIVSEAAGTWKNRFASDATISRISPTNRNLPRNEKSFFVTVAIVAIAKNTAAVNPPARPISSPPFLNCPATVRIGVQHQACDERETEQRRNAHRAVAQTGDHEQHANHHAEHQQRRHDGRGPEQTG